MLLIAHILTACAPLASPKRFRNLLNQRKNITMRANTQSPDTMDLIDIGCNLTHDSFEEDREAVISRAQEAGVSRMVVTGASKDGSSKALQLAQDYPGVIFATAGVHPHRASDYGDETDKLLRDLTGHDLVVAAGETGLDYFRDLSPRDVQREVFEAQLQIGIDAGLPMFLHLRRSCANTWISTVISASPAGSATSAAVFT